MNPHLMPASLPEAAQTLALKAEHLSRQPPSLEMLAQARELLRETATLLTTLAIRVDQHEAERAGADDMLAELALRIAKLETERR